MAFPQKHLYNNEQIVLDRYPHWAFLAVRSGLLVAACALGIVALVLEAHIALKWAAVALIAVAFGFFFVRFLGWRATKFVITTERCIYRSGVLKKTGIEIPLDRISTVFFSQTVWERMLGAGDLGIESAGEGSRQDFSNISKPMEVQNIIYRQMEEHENRKYDRIGSETREGWTDAAASSLSVAEQLEKLADLRDRGVITATEFEAQKQQLLG